MELALLVYLVNLLTTIDIFLSGVIGFALFLAVAGAAFTAIYLSDNDGDFADWRRIWCKYWLWHKVLVTSLIVSWVIPDDKTIEYMAGAYLIQTTYESEFVQTASTLAGKAVLNQLTVWAEDNKDVVVLLNQLKEQGVDVKDIKLPVEKDSK